MAERNDNLILQLQKQIDDKEAALAKIERFRPVTNCSLVLDGDRFNLQVPDVDLLNLALVKLNIYKMSADNLGLTDFKVSGYTLEDWFTDVNAKLLIANRSVEESKLKAWKKRLRNLLSEDKKVELELDELKELIGAGL